MQLYGEITVEQAYILLKKYNVSERRVKHSEEVARLAREYARKISETTGITIDLDFIHTAGLLHDIGRGYIIKITDDDSEEEGNNEKEKKFKKDQTSKQIYDEPDMHMFIGEKILRDEGLEKYARIAERHGFAKEAAVTYGKPGVYEPETIEEKIITIADLNVVKRGIITVDERFECLRNTFTERKLLWRLKHLEDAEPRIKDYEMELMILGAMG
jgi:hypothetical protein